MKAAPTSSAGRGRRSSCAPTLARSTSSASRSTRTARSTSTPGLAPGEGCGPARYGGAGLDTLSGEGGDDDLDARDGEADLTGGERGDVIRGGRGGDVLRPGGGIDYVDLADARFEREVSVSGGRDRIDLRDGAPDEYACDRADRGAVDADAFDPIGTGCGSLLRVGDTRPRAPGRSARIPVRTGTSRRAVVVTRDGAGRTRTERVRLRLREP